MKKILMATDLSARSDRALQRAFNLAKDLGADLEVLHIVDDALPGAVAVRQKQAADDAIKEQLDAMSTDASLKLTSNVIVGQDYSDILRHALEQEADVIVLGIHRHSTLDLFRGTTVERIVRFGSIPVLVVRDVVAGPYRRVLVPVDLSDHSRAAMTLAASVVPEGEVHLVHCTDEPFSGFLGAQTLRQHVREEQAQFSKTLDAQIAELTNQLGAAAPKFKSVMRTGGVSEVVRDELDRLKPDLLALGTHGRTGLAHAIVGSVAENMLADAPVDVMAVKAR